MEAIQISYRSLSNHRDGKRLYIQGLKLGTAGYSVGSSYQITEVPETNSLILKSTETGDRKVSRKKLGLLAEVMQNTDLPNQCYNTPLSLKNGDY